MTDKQKSILYSIDMKIAVLNVKIEVIMKEWRALSENVDMLFNTLYEDVETEDKKELCND